MGTATIAIMGVIGWGLSIAGDFFANTFNGTLIEGFGNSLTSLGHSIVAFVVAVITLAIIVGLSILSKTNR